MTTKYLPVYILIIGKVADYALTNYGLSRGLVELNPTALSLPSITLSLLIYPFLLFILSGISYRHRYSLILYLPGMVAWVIVGWNLGALFLGGI